MHALLSNPSSIVRLGLFLLVPLFMLLIPDPAVARPLQISMQVPKELLALPVTGLAVNDGLGLLQKAFPVAVVSLNRRHADIQLILPQLKKNISDGPSNMSLRDPDRQPRETSYHWHSQHKAGITVLRLTAATPEGVACGLYGLLQEKLGIRFVHPRQTVFPKHTQWPLPEAFTFAGRPRFRNRGFHLHTLHPTELTEQLHDPRLPDSYEEVTTYLDWLARNGQNSFQFFLLRDIDRNAWIQHARRIVDYAHRRGIRCGVEISLAMLQQQAFQSITLLRPFPSYRRQVDDTLAWLFLAPWDFISLEATMGEHLPLLGKLLPDVQAHFEEQVTQRYKARLLYATHVIGQEDGEKVRRPILPTSGILIHTVMCYSASEPKAPVYGNVNQRFMLEALQQEASRRETWYWPESSYWVAFDSSVPLLLLPYLEARWQDIQTMAQVGVDGHLTFSSGWEWGYWLIDWSIARWSWSLTESGRTVKDSPVSRFETLFPDPVIRQLWRQALTLQNVFLKDRELLRYLAALTPFSELPPPLNRPFQPDPGFRYAWLLRDASRTEAQALLAGPIADLESYAARMERLTASATPSLVHEPLADELLLGLRVTALRARHRALTLRALLARKEEIHFLPTNDKKSEQWLTMARSTRQQALVLVRRQEGHYRYPLERLAQRRPSLTAYPFGYLYPASTLFFWEREEEQIRNNRFDPFFMKLWNFRRTLGLGSLF